MGKNNYLKNINTKKNKKNPSEKLNDFKVILDCSFCGIMAFDAFYDKKGELIDFIITVANRQACKIVNFKEEELVGKRLSEILKGNFKPLETLEGRTLFDNYKEVVLTGKSKSLEFYFQGDGLNEWFRNKAVKYNNGFVCTFEIITKEKFFQKQLEERVNQEVEKQRKQEKLLIQQSKMAAMGEMIGAIAHNWRQPINTVSLLCVAMENRFDNSKISKDYLDKWIDKMNKQINFMSQTIDDFRNFYSPKEEYKKIFLKQTILKIVSLINYQFRLSNIQINIDIPSSISLVCLENQLQQAIINMLVNSKDAILNSNVKNGFILISAKKNKSSIELIIQDNGKGILDKKVLNYIFDPYFTTKIKSHGTGIGLYMTKIIIEQNLGGKIKVKNMDDGLRFKIKLPFLSI